MKAAIFENAESQIYTQLVQMESNVEGGWWCSGARKESLDKDIQNSVEPGK
jgi:hypothetical protein